MNNRRIMKSATSDEPTSGITKNGVFHKDARICAVRATLAMISNH